MRLKSVSSVILGLVLLLTACEETTIEGDLDTSPPPSDTSTADTSDTSTADADACLGQGQDSCGANATCTITIGGGHLCACLSGYEGDGVSCSDIDECASNNGGCDQNCHNAAGTFSCSCEDGYDLAGDGLGCESINACDANVDGCEQSCTDNDGTYVCGCFDGYTLAGDGKSCTPCAAGTYDNDGEDSTSCVACLAGSVQAQTGRGECSICEAGTHDDGSEVCAGCAGGRVQPDAGQTSCVACTAGFYDDGSEVCAGCGNGLVQPNAGQTSCVGCTAGFHDDGSEVCAGCAGGLVQPDAGQTSCVECTAGFYDDGSEVCAACIPGTYQPNSGSQECQTCTTCAADAYPMPACTATTDATCVNCPSISIDDCAEFTCTTSTNGSCLVCSTGFAPDGSGGCEESASCGLLGVCPTGYDCISNTYCEDSTGGTVYVPAGTFWMGCNAAVESCTLTNELEQHQVTLSAYSIDKTEVTAGAYKSCVDAGGCSTPSGTGGTDATYDVVGKEDHPITHVSWAQAGIHCAWSGKAAGVQALCTEAQWERAAKGGCEVHGASCQTGMPIYPWGNAPATCSYAVMNDGSGENCGGPRGTSAVGTKPAGISPYGAMDMAGSAVEWTHDRFASFASGHVTDPMGPASGGNRAIRGGYFGDAAIYMRSSFRTALQSSWAGGGGVGFRCCATGD